MKACLHIFGIVTILAVSALPGLAAGAGFGGTYTFTVLRNGEEVGLHTFTFRHEGDRTQIEVQSDFEVKLAFIPIFTFSHHHRQLWENGRFVESEAVTDKNGDEVEVTLEAGPDGLERTVNGKRDHLQPGITPLTVWNPEILDDTRFVSIADDKVIEAPFDYLGSEVLEIAGKPLKTEHFRLGGEENREVWYDPAGHVARVRLVRGDSVIDYVRNEPTLDLPQQFACSTVAALGC